MVSHHRNRTIAAIITAFVALSLALLIPLSVTANPLTGLDVSVECADSGHLVHVHTGHIDTPRTITVIGQVRIAGVWQDSGAAVTHEIAVNTLNTDIPITIPLPSNADAYRVRVVSTTLDNGTGELSNVVTCQHNNTATPTSTATSTSTVSPTSTSTPTATSTSTSTSTATPTATPTSTLVVDHTPTRTALPTSTATSTPTTPPEIEATPTRTSVPTVVSSSTPTMTPMPPVMATDTPTSIAPVTVAQSSSGLSSGRMSEYCHYEPSTGQWEIRRTSDLDKALRSSDNKRVIADHVCVQQPTSTPTVANLSATATVTSAPTDVTTDVPTSTPTATTMVDATPVPDMVDVSSVTVVDVPEIQMPLKLPEAGDGTTYVDGDTE